MDKVKKRDRNANFSREETEKLICLVDKFKKIIENKKSDAVTWQEKEKAWKIIESEYNCYGTEIFRDAKHLKLKFEAIKRDIRKKYNALRHELYETEGGSVIKVPRLTPIEQRVKQMISLSVDGGDPDPLVTYDTPPLGTCDSTPLGTCDSAPLGTCDSAPLGTCNSAPQGTWDSEPLDTSKETRPFDQFTHGKLEILQLQKAIIEEDVEEKQMKKRMMEMEMEHKKELHELEKEERLLRISILKCDLENKRKSNT